MFEEVDYQQVVGEVSERNRFFKALLEIQKIAENINGNNFEAQSDSITEICRQALKNKSITTSKN